MIGSAVARTQQSSVLGRLHLEGPTQEMASQIINALQQAGRGTEPISPAARTSENQRKKQKAELVVVLHRPVGPLRPLNSWLLAGEFTLSSSLQRHVMNWHWAPNIHEPICHIVTGLENLVH